jgi:multiple sugar transport system permease protein
VIWTIAPYVWLVISSLSFKIDLVTVPLKWIPTRLTLENFKGLFFENGEVTFNTGLFIKALINSAIISFSTMLVSLPIGILASYAATRIKFKGNKLVLLTGLMAQMVPPIILVIPLYVIMRYFDLLDKHLGLILVDVSICLPLIIWLMRGYFSSIPADLEDAARIDGASRLTALVRIVLPLAGPGLVSVMIFAFISSWNEYLFAFVFTNAAAKTLPVLIGEFSTKLGLEYLKIAAAGVLASLPPVILALVFQRHIISGLTSGSVK